jgi:hypothetical protein
MLKDIARSGVLGGCSFINLNTGNPKAPGQFSWFNGKPGLVLDHQGNNIPLDTLLDNPHYDICNIGLHLRHNAPLTNIDIDTSSQHLRSLAILALQHNGVDIRLGYGRFSNKAPSNFLVNLAQDDVSIFGSLLPVMPKRGISINDEKLHVEVRRSYKKLLPKGTKTVEQNPDRFDVSKDEADGWISQLVQRLIHA